jgi:hypothetical protein
VQAHQRRPGAAAVGGREEDGYAAALLSLMRATAVMMNSTA